ncbi:chorismate mutase [Ferruginivarius sediminum]|uniref:chorismate mutase n=1 Tax=Ferruginivarius sediminum TaxID=2661937 RepID=A0A369TAK6_9PROT|nr:chorismate mutase [Ferruginivarius sediminum]RDD61902.1 chorismate mutase [Ferruginivarius sediminum]
MTSADPSLPDLRREIDEIDNQIHDLLIRRGELQAAVVRAKQGSSVYIRPGREAMVLRRLCARHQGRFPKAVLVRIWREIFSAGLSLQGEFSIAVLNGGGCGNDLRALARDHFGALTPFSDMGTAARVLQAVADGKATVGVLPMPESEESEPWWPRLARAGGQVPRIIARLPFAGPGSRAGNAEALAVALVPPEETGNDRSYLAVETARETSRSALRDAMGKAGFQVTDWKSWVGGNEQALYLVECEGTLDERDPRLDALAADNDFVGTAWPIGSYAVPLSSEELA